MKDLAILKKSIYLHENLNARSYESRIKRR